MSEGGNDTTLQQPVMTFSERPTAKRPGVIAFDLVSSSLKVIRLEEGAVLEVGRAPECGLVITDSGVSRKHLTVAREQGGFRVHDTSANGSVIDGARIEGMVRVADASDQAHPVVRVGSTFVLLAADVLSYEYRSIRIEDNQVLGALNQLAHDAIDRASESKLTLLIQAETGSGKDYAAQRYHMRGPRKSGPYVTINCANIQANLAEAALFGTRKGGFTGAENEIGLFGAADRGTLFLDEIGELDLGVQAKLLRVLQNGEYIPVGSTQVRHADVRVVAATHRDLAQRAEDGTFRTDLLHRIRQAHVTIHPLRERREELPTLVRTLLGELEPTIELVESCMLHPWPGNVRELQPAMIQAAESARKRGSAQVSSEDLPAHVKSVIASRLRVSSPPQIDAKTAALIAACETNGGDVAAAAESVELKKSQAYERLAKAGYKPRARK